MGSAPKARGRRGRVTEAAVTGHICSTHPCPYLKVTSKIPTPLFR